MKLIKMIVNDYRQFDKAELNFDNDVTIIAGANNSGKTSLITLIRNMFTSEKITYTESDIPAKNMKLWIDRVFPLFEDFFDNGKSIEQIETDLIEKILPESDDDEKILIKTTEVYMQIDYDDAKDDIKLFADYIMDLDENKHSFYFIYTFEVNGRLFSKNVSESYDKLKKRFAELEMPNRDLKQRYLQQLLVKLYVNSIKPICYFCDKDYINRCKMDDVKEFRNLFNFTYIKASRPLDDDDTDHSHMLSKQMIKMVKLDENWNVYYQCLLKPAIQNFLVKDGVTNAKACLRENLVYGALSAYKLFYVGCSRARRNLSIIVDKKDIQGFEERLIRKFEKCGFKVIKNNID